MIYMAYCLNAYSEMCTFQLPLKYILLVWISMHPMFLLYALNWIAWLFTPCAWNFHSNEVRKSSKAFCWHFICWPKTSRTRFCLAKLVLTILVLVIHHALPLLPCSLRHQSSSQRLLLLLTLWNIALSSGTANAFTRNSCCVLADLIISLSL